MADGDAQAAAAAGAPVEVVDVDGTVTGVVSRAAMRAGRLRHRCTYIVVIDGRGRLVVHQRAGWKDVWPSRWDIAFGGVVGVGEDWAEAAARELAEEAGVVLEVGSLDEVAAGPYDDGDVSVLGRVYVARSDGPFTFPDGEVAADDRIPLAEVASWMDGRELCPDSVALAGPAIGSLAAVPNPTIDS